MLIRFLPVLLAAVVAVPVIGPAPASAASGGLPGIHAAAPAGDALQARLGGRGFGAPRRPVLGGRRGYGYPRRPYYRRSSHGFLRGVLTGIGISWLAHTLFGWGSGGGSPWPLILIVLAIVWLMSRSRRRRRDRYAY
jgi:hypothetical protein